MGVTIALKTEGEKRGGGKDGWGGATMSIPIDEEKGGRERAPKKDEKPKTCNHS